MRTGPAAATVVRIGIVAPGGGRTARAVHLGVTLDAVLGEVADRVPPPYRTPAWHRRADGGHATLLIPPAVPHRWVATGLVTLLGEALRRRNRHLNEFGKLRLRLAADHGDVVQRPSSLGGAAVARAAWLCEADVLKAALAAMPEAELLLIVSDRFHTALAGGPAFRRVVVPVGGEPEVAWLQAIPDAGTWNSGAGGGLALS